MKLFHALKITTFLQTHFYHILNLNFMKVKKITLALFSLLAASFFLAAQAQMQRLNATVGDYTKCIEYCKGLGNSQERIVCMEGCRYVGIVSVNVKALTTAISLVDEINKKPASGNDNLFYTDDKGQQYFATYFKGNLTGYKIIDKKGNDVPFRLISIQTTNSAAQAKCYIFMPDGTLREVKCPDVIIIVRDLALSFE
jgi:hypothetical protein